MFQQQARAERYEISQALLGCKLAEGSSVSAHVIMLHGYVQALHHSRRIPTDQLVGNAPYADRKSVGNHLCRPTWSVTESPVGKCLSRPTTLCRPTVRRFVVGLPTDLFFADRRFNPDRLCYADRPLDGDIITDRLSVGVRSIPDQLVCWDSSGRCLLTVRRCFFFSDQLFNSLNI